MRGMGRWSPGILGSVVFWLAIGSPGFSVEAGGAYNPRHDFPKRVLYGRNTDGSLDASIDGGEGTRAPSWHYLPAKR